MRLAEILDVLATGPLPSLMVLATVFIFGVALPDILVKIFLLSLPSMFETVNSRKVYVQALRPRQLWTETRNAAESYLLDIVVFSAFVTFFWRQYAVDVDPFLQSPQSLAVPSALLHVPVIGKLGSKEPIEQADTASEISIHARMVHRMVIGKTDPEE